MQYRAQPAGSVGEEGGFRGGRHAAGVHHNYRHRRHRHGPSGDEVLSGVSGPDCRQRGTDGAGALLRCPGRTGGVRQIAAGHDDGDAAAERTERVHVWRVDFARDVQGTGRHRGRCVRSSGSARGRRDVRRRICMRWRSLPVRPLVRAAGNSRQIQWRWCRRRSGWRCQGRRGLQRLTRSGTALRWSQARR